MSYHDLRQFLVDRMKMSHIYQPVMIKCLLRNNGTANDIQIANEISLRDPSQAEYYQNITNNMVGRVLRSHEIVTRHKKAYRLNGFGELTDGQVKELINICNEKLEEYIRKRGKAIWNHRTRGRSPIPGSVKYEVLKRAHFRCELCGCMDSERALQVDHITPSTLGGENSIHNYQALCYCCNAMKRHHDNADLRGIDSLYGHRSDDCVFCKMDKSRIITQNNLAYLVYDKHPVTAFHMLVIPKRHFAEYFDIFQPEVNAVQALLLEGRELVSKKDNKIKGFNIGVNSGEVAGQTIHHCHTHLIPRRENDVANPRGGVRHVIQGKGDY